MPGSPKMTPGYKPRTEEGKWGCIQGTELEGKASPHMVWGGITWQWPGGIRTRRGAPAAFPTAR